MIILITLFFITALGVLSLVYHNQQSRYDDTFWGIGMLLIAFGGVGLIIALIVLPVNYYQEIGNIEKYLSIQQSINYARENNPDILERAAIIRTITEYNGWLAKIQYWNGTIFDWYIPDEVEKLKPIK